MVSEVPRRHGNDITGLHRIVFSLTTCIYECSAKLASALHKPA
jgi:hypothetical protein